MNSYDINFEMAQLVKKVISLDEKVTTLTEKVAPNENLWDKQDMLNNWHISERTLANWRANGLIDYVQIGKKIWYSQKARENFMAKNTVISKERSTDE